MTGSASCDLGWSLQKAVYGQLSNDTGVAAALGTPARIYDTAPKRPTFPFVTFGEWRVAPLSGAPDTFEHDIKIRVFSRYEGRKETRLAMAAIHGALHDAPLVPVGRSLISFRFLFADIFLRADGRTWNGIMRFRAVDTTETID
ncbi:MAG: DUF3168 domain-containing protein [Pseudomonadota bacterium]